MDQEIRNALRWLIQQELQPYFIVADEKIDYKEREKRETETIERIFKTGSAY